MRVKQEPSPEAVQVVVDFDHIMGTLAPGIGKDQEDRWQICLSLLHQSHQDRYSRREKDAAMAVAEPGFEFEYEEELRARQE